MRTGYLRAALLCACVLTSLVFRQTKPVPILSYCGVFSYSIYLIHPVAFAFLFCIKGYATLSAGIAVPRLVVIAVTWRIDRGVTPLCPTHRVLRVLTGARSAVSA